MPQRTPAIGDERLREILERNAKAVALRPAVGQATARTAVTLKPGLSCEVREGPWTLTVGMSEKSGGTNAGPNPGVLGRAALGSCLALCYAMWAARLGIVLDAVDVDVEADYDSRGELGVSDEVPPGYLQVRYRIRISSSSPEADVPVVLVRSPTSTSPYRDVFARAHDVRRELVITPSIVTEA